MSKYIKGNINVVNNTSVTSSNFGMITIIIFLDKAYIISFHKYKNQIEIPGLFQCCMGIY